ncbi:MAG: sulfurtransferase TusA family protein [Spirochaetaceae bacterium]|jgi:TusA-related sulfurtransferase|nr:sulfurtransferase TusA family protein [Spirochaetaceae bacterium]
MKDQTSGPEPDARVDITAVVCPVTFVKTKVALDELDEGQILEVRLNDGEPIQNIPRSLKDEGHRVISVNKAEDGAYLLRVVKGGLA